MKRLITFVCGVVLSILAVSAVIYADDISNNIDASIDATAESKVMNLGDPDTAVGLLVTPRNGDGKNGCNLTSSTTFTVGVNSSNSAVATVSPSSITFNSCGDLPNITVHAVGTGATTVSLTAGTNTTGGTFNLAPATFTVTVNAPSDTTAPVITPHVTPAANANGWNNSDVNVSWTVSDLESAITSTSGCDSSSLTSETTGTTLTCAATSAGGSNSKSVTIKIDKTKPAISGSASPAANGNGWNNTNVDVGFVCADDGTVQSGLDTNTVAGTTLNTDGADQSATNTGTCTDKAGNTADSATVSGINIDKDKPVISFTRLPVANGFGWNNSDVEVGFTCSDGSGSGLDVNTVAGDTVSDEGVNQSVTNSGECTDLAGNMADAVTVDHISIDKTNPIITGSRSPLANVNGWNNTSVTVSFTCAEDGLVQSGIDSNNVLGDILSSEGSGQSVTNTGTCTDKAGNTADSATVSDINIDKTAPEITITTPANNAHYTFHQVVNANWSVSDSLSGLDGSPSGTTASGSPINTNSLGSKSYTVSADDLAGNHASTTVNYTVDPYLFGNFQAPLSLDSKSFKQNSTIPVKFQLKDVNGGYIANATATLLVDGNMAIAGGGSNLLNFFRYDPSGNQYIFNLSTKQLTKGTHTLTVTLDDGSAPKTVTITVK